MVAGVLRFKGSVAVADNLLPELLAICMGLMIVWERLLRRVHCESDSLEAIPLIHTAEEHHCYSALLAEIRDWVRKDWMVKISHVLREANQCADHLAKDGAVSGESLIFMEDPPAGVLDCLREDFLGTFFMRA